MIKCLKTYFYGELAQLARALPLQGRGRGFKSLILHHYAELAELV